VKAAVGGGGGNDRGAGTPTTPTSGRHAGGAGRTSGPASTAPSSGGSPTSPASSQDDPSTPGPINTAFPGLVTFRGNATRTYYGEGPLPSHPKVLWQYPQSGGLCSISDGGQGPKRW